MDYLAPKEDLIVNNIAWQVEKTHQVVWGALLDYGRVEW